MTSRPTITQPRANTWDDFEKKLKTSIGPFLAENDIVDEETRELHDAVLRLAVEEPERVGELVLEHGVSR
ncbi:hypothetical protein D8Y22_14855 [Salinadaptatus halalkaliphilus]|uniref:Uncharacterized protein n=1 Tax=Salinadaptatus halalkaliphilus TaxID=2419781 RepID=A0A4S3TL87_9EURY|nr:hypothetical protein [Salinadaptatus halalkaliphilus]THE64003.1 hypothetical protein D8Y22_14855 [Salinadaptatus halalkaliphilus]